ncbi:hypothetical protein T440DRAFT_557349 [Plenodomus tracheiphilus IPT5]|uniref:Uncharacterized protein n=1 Tax=Plenodomus tracheiphilus IPT5 TaxID=1408161 RepID=A0A6A7AYG2_9PLEO|nr:hypothetical protein T440DRAFT_557349 [Plenodomus tracheiphilus IPT5]
MLRLKKPSRSDDTRKTSSKSLREDSRRVTSLPTATAVSHARAEAAAEEATPQLLVDPVSKPPSTAAALGASLLNNARLGQSHSSPAGVAARTRVGMLKRPGLAAEGSARQRASRGDIYAIELSPEKKALSPRNKVHDAPPTAGLTKTKKKAPEHRPRDHQQQSDLQLSLPEPFSLPSSPRAVVTKSHRRVTRQPVRVQAHKMRNSQAVDDPLTRRSKPEVQIPVRERRKRQTTHGDRVPHRHLSESLIVPLEVEDEPQIEAGQTIPSHRQLRSSKKQKTSHIPEASAEGSPNSAPSSVPTDADETDISEDQVDEVQPRPSATIDTVFEFLGRERRSGTCQTAYGSTIRRICKENRNALMNDDSTLATVMASAGAIRDVIQQTLLEVQENDRRALKRDAYAYLFRALLLLLKAAFNWLHERDVVIMASLDAMRIVTPFMREILSLKNTIARWRVSVPQRFKGDSLIMEVDSHLIVPLRQVYKAYSVKLSQLEAAEERRMLHRKLRKEEADKQGRSKALARRRQRQQRWQDLHIARMQFEPDPFRRRRLVITCPGDLEERDANGIKFERVPVFKPRSSPPLHREAAHSQESTWTDEEEILLLEAVQAYAGTQLYEHIFRAHCRPGGILRDFTVAEIVAKVSWIRSSWFRLQQEKGWEAPTWVQELPAWP